MAKAAGGAPSTAPRSEPPPTDDGVVTFHRAAQQPALVVVGAMALVGILLSLRGDAVEVGRGLTFGPLILAGVSGLLAVLARGRLRIDPGGVEVHAFPARPRRVAWADVDRAELTQRHARGPHGGGQVVPVLLLEGDGQQRRWWRVHPGQVGLLGFPVREVLVACARAARGPRPGLARRLEALAAAQPWRPPRERPRWEAVVDRWGLPAALVLLLVGAAGAVGTETIAEPRAAKADARAEEERRHLRIDEWFASEELADGLRHEIGACTTEEPVAADRDDRTREVEWRCPVTVTDGTEAVEVTVLVVGSRASGYQLEGPTAGGLGGRLFPVSDAGLDRLVSEELGTDASCDMVGEDPAADLAVTPVWDHTVACRTPDGEVRVAVRLGDLEARVVE